MAIPTLCVNSVRTLRSSGYAVFERIGRLHARIDALPLGVRQRPRRNAGGEITESFIGWNAAGGGVRLREVAVIGQIGHDVSDSRGAERKMAQASKCPRSNRFAGFDMGADNLVKDRPLPRRKLSLCRLHRFKPSVFTI